MKKIIVLIGFLSICSFAWAVDVDRYAVEREDGGVSIVSYVKGSTKSFEKVLEDNGLSGRPITALSDADIPKTRADRKYWKMSGKKIVINEFEKQEDLLKAQQLESDKTAILEKLKISKEEYAKLNQKSITASVN